MYSSIPATQVRYRENDIWSYKPWCSSVCDILYFILLSFLHCFWFFLILTIRIFAHDWYSKTNVTRKKENQILLTFHLWWYSWHFFLYSFIQTTVTNQILEYVFSFWKSYNFYAFYWLVWFKVIKILLLLNHLV